MRDYEIYEPDGKTKQAVSAMPTDAIRKILQSPSTQLAAFDDGTGTGEDPPLDALLERLRLELDIRAQEGRL